VNLNVVFFLNSMGSAMASHSYFFSAICVFCVVSCIYLCRCFCFIQYSHSHSDIIIVDALSSLFISLCVSHKPYYSTFPLQRSGLSRIPCHLHLFSLLLYPPQSSAEVKEKVELYLYFPSGPSWPVLGWTLPLPYCYSPDLFIVSEWRESNLFRTTDLRPTFRIQPWHFPWTSPYGQ
jgi:hypothetical protein